MSEQRDESGFGKEPTRANGQPDLDAVDLVEESVAIFGLDLRVKAWNAGAERLYGWKREEVIGGVIQAAVRCSPSEPLPVIMAQVQQSGTWRGEFTRTTKSGATVAVQSKWTLRRDQGGRPLDIVETSRDITTLRNTEEALDLVKYQYQNLFQASVASFWELEFAGVGAMIRDLRASGVVDLRDYFARNPTYVRQMIRATKILDVNAQTLSMFGHGRRAELFKSLDPFWPDESLVVFAGSVLSALEGNSHYSSEAVFCSLDGERFDTLFTMSYPPRLSQSSKLLVGILDVTQAKRAKAAQEYSERRYRGFFHFLPVALLHLESRNIVDIFTRARAEGIVDFADCIRSDPDVIDRILDGLRIVEANQRAVTMLRAPSAEALEGCSVARYWTLSRDVFCKVATARYAGQPGFEALVRMPAHDGTIFDALFFAAFGPITGAHNVSLVGLIDVSDRVKAQEMLAHVQSEIAHAARVSVLGELTASIAHEVSQPLTAIETNTEASLLWLAASPPSLDEVRELSARTAAEAQRAADIIHRIRSMAIRAEPEMTAVALNLTIEDALLFLRHELQRNEVATQLRLAPHIPYVVGDRVQLQQVIVNLGMNAIQAMSLTETSNRVLELRTSMVENGWIEIIVEDTGPGIVPNALGRMFESFFTTKAAGMGMGLPICRTIIESHGGHISAENCQARRGARFRIILPAGSAEP
jgi:PAS domain S-box-containing protein